MYLSQNHTFQLNNQFPHLHPFQMTNQIHWVLWFHHAVKCGNHFYLLSSHLGLDIQDIFLKHR